MSRHAIGRAEKLQELERWSDSIDALADADALDPIVQCRRALAYYFLGDDARALESARAALSLDPEEEWAHRLVSGVLTRRMQHADALAAAEEALRVEPYSYYAWLNLFYTRKNAGRYEDLSDIVDRLIELRPHDSDSFEAASFLAVHENRFEDAERHLRRAIELDASNAELHMQLASVLRKLRRRRGEVARPLARALELNPALQSARTSLIEVMSPRAGRAVFAFIAFQIAALLFVIGGTDTKVAQVVAISATAGFIVVNILVRRRLLTGLGETARAIVRRRRRELLLNGFVSALQGVAVILGVGCALVILAVCAMRPGLLIGLGWGVWQAFRNARSDD